MLENCLSPCGGVFDTAFVEKESREVFLIMKITHTGMFRVEKH